MKLVIKPEESRSVLSGVGEVMEVPAEMQTKLIVASSKPVLFTIDRYRKTESTNWQFRSNATSDVCPYRPVSPLTGTLPRNLVLRHMITVFSVGSKISRKVVLPWHGNAQKHIRMVKETRWTRWIKSADDWPWEKKSKVFSTRWKLHENR